MKKHFVLSALIGLLSSGAFAQGYAGAGLGLGKVNVDCSGAALTCDTSTATGKLFAGYMFDEKMGIEAGFINFGKGTASGVFAQNTPLSVSLENQTFALSLFALHPISPSWSIISRFGLASNKSTISAGVMGFTVSESKSAFAPYGSIGAAYQINPNVALEATFEGTVFTPVKDLDMDKYGAYFGGIAVRYKF